MNGLNHVAISAADYDGLKAFYENLFGLETIFELEFKDGRYLETDFRPADKDPVVGNITGLKGCAGRQTFYTAGNAHVEIFDFQNPTPKRRDPEWRVFDHGISHLCFQVDSVQAWYDRLSANGMEFYCPPQDFGPVINTYGVDPEGNVVELIEPVPTGQEPELGFTGADLDIANRPLAKNTGKGSDTRVTGLHHCGISVTNFEQSQAFYQDIFGAEPLFEMDFSDGRFDTIWRTTGSSGRALMLKFGNAFFEFFLFRNPQPKARDPEARPCDHGLPHFSIEVDDVDDWYQRLQKQGVRFTAPVQDFGDVRAAYAYDPDGNVIELFGTLESGHMLSVIS